MSRAVEPMAAVAAFIDCINRCDLDGLAVLMTENHRLVVDDEAPISGRAAVLDAWRSYLDSFPDYVIFRRHVACDGGRVTVVGTTTGSHLALAPEEEMKLSVIWVAQVTGGRLSTWSVTEDTPQRRADLGVPASA